MRVSSLIVLGMIALSTGVGRALADTIWTGSGTGRGLRQQVDILGVENSQLVYLLNGNRVTTPLLRVQQIELESDAAFSGAEQAYNAGDWQKAVVAYAAASRSHSKEWVRRRAAERLLMAAGNGGLLDEAVSGYVQLTLLDPPAAVGRELPVEEAGEEQLARAVGQLQQALENRSLRPDQRKPLLTLLLALQTRRGDQEAAARVVEQLAPIVGENPDEDPKLYAQVMLGRATLSLSRNEPDEAVRLINANQQVFTDAQQQSEALMILARAAEQRAGEDRGGLLDASLAYMKVVAHFRRAEGAPNVPEALLRVGAIHERLGLSTAAAGLYQEIVTTYPQSPVAAEAQRRLEAVQPPSATRPAGGS